MVYFESGRSIFITQIEEFLMDYAEFKEDEVMNPNYEQIEVKPMFDSSKFTNNTQFNQEFVNTQFNQNSLIEEKTLNKPEFSLLFKGKNIVSKSIKMDIDLKVPTDFIIKGLLSAYGLADIEPSLIYMIKEQLISDLDNISKNISNKILNKLKNFKEKD